MTIPTTTPIRWLLVPDWIRGYDLHLPVNRKHDRGHNNVPKCWLHVGGSALLGSSWVVLERMLFAPVRFVYLLLQL